MQFTKYKNHKELCELLESSFVIYLQDKDVYKLHTFLITTISKTSFTVKLGLGEYSGSCKVKWIEKDGKYNDKECLKQLISFADELICKNPSKISEVDASVLNTAIKEAMELPKGMLISANVAREKTKSMSFLTRLKEAWSIRKFKEAVPIIGRYSYEDLMAVIYGEIRRRCDLDSRVVVFTKMTENNFWDMAENKLEELGFAIVSSKHRLIITW